MRGRVRHLNPSNAGAVSALDARFLSGFSDGNTIGTWTSRTGNNSPTQSTEANKPLYKVALQGGCPGVLVDDTASASGRFATWSSTPISGATAATFVYACKRTSDAGNGAPVCNFGNSFYADHNPYGGGGSYLSLGSSIRHEWSSSIPLNSLNIESITSKIDQFTVRQLGTSIYTAGNTVGIGLYPRIGANGGLRPSGAVDSAYYWVGHIYSVNVFAFELSNPLRKLLEHSIAFSFKIKTN
jgi:hypothetical protein